MHLNRKVIKSVLAIAVPLGMVGSMAFVNGAASAKTKPIKGSISCNTVSATVTFNPPLTPGASTTKKETTTITNTALANCSSSASSATAATDVTVKPIKGKSNTCSDFASSAGKSKFGFAITWNGDGGTSKASFKGATFNTAPIGFTLSNGKVTKSFASKSGTITANVDPSDGAALATCIGGSGPGVSVIHITSGSTTL